MRARIYYPSNFLAIFWKFARANLRKKKKIRVSSRKWGGRFRGTNGRKWTSVDYHKETMRDERAERERSSAPLLLAGSSFSAPEPIQVDERRFSFSPLADRLYPPLSPPIFLGDFPPRALPSETWEVAAAKCNVQCDATAGVHHRWKLETSAALCV